MRLTVIFFHIRWDSWGFVKPDIIIHIIDQNENIVCYGVLESSVRTGGERAGWAIRIGMLPNFGREV